ncbi:MAG: hypothetical protein ACMVP2_16880 [Imperialibacter sp.]|uniref:hypothetical protein n=1 Tax=Imperialibacter sp. TaxID=2038411 RepID=UPI003A8429AC
MVATENNIEDYIGAISRLFNFASSKRYKIVQPTINTSDEIGKLSSEINDEIIDKIGINIFKTVDFFDILKYENELNKTFTDFSDKNIISSEEIEDEVTLLRSYKPMSKSYFSENKYTISNKLDSTLAGKLPITTPTILSSAKHPDHLHVIEDGDMRSNYFATSLASNKVLIYHLAENQENKSILEIQQVLAFSALKYKELLSNPTRLFLGILDEYGVDLTLNNVTRRFFKFVKLMHEEIDGSLKIFEAKNIGKDDFSIQFQLMKKEFGIVVQFAYGINSTQYTKEVLKQFR